MIGILPSKELESSTKNMVVFLAEPQVTIPMSPEFTSVLQHCQVVELKKNR